MMRTLVNLLGWQLKHLWTWES